MVGLIRLSSTVSRMIIGLVLGYGALSGVNTDY